MLRNKVAIVTGAADGIGKAIATVLAREGANVVVNDIDIEKAEEVVNEIKKSGYQAIAVQADVSNAEEVQGMIEKTLSVLGTINILVNNAGICIYKSIEDTTERDFNKVMDVNLKGTFLCTKAVVKFMKKHRSGKIINIASEAAVAGSAVSSAIYAASKGGVIGFTRSLARQLGPYGINVNAVAPGWVDTSMTKLLPKKVKNDRIKQTPLRRIGTPEDIAKVVAFLASDAANFISGEVIIVGGGYVIA